MVFESVVTDVLNKILGDYVENLDSKQLKIGIWGGDVVLHNLKLRENALDDLNLPVQLVYGYLGKLVLKIPWKNLYSQPVVAQIEDFYILISPKQSIKYDQEKEDKYDLQTKQAALLALDEAHKRELEKDKPKPDASFAEKLTAQIVNNLQAKITNVHIRYEDTSTTGEPFAFGITLSDLEVYTTDANWMKCYLTEQVSRVYKIANLDSLSVYMNCNSNLFVKHDHDKLPTLFRENIARKAQVPEKYTYILSPISSMAKLQLNMNPQYDSPAFEIPKIDLCLEMEQLSIGLTSTQFQDVLKLGDSMNRMQLGMPYRKYRPFNIPYKNHYKEWWKFAITAVLEEDIRKRNRSWTWEHMKSHRELCTNYAEKFKEKELTKKPSASLIETCTLIEQKLDLLNLVLIRQRCQFEIDRKRKEEEKKVVSKGGWISSWFGGGAKKEHDDDSNDIVHKFQAAMTDEEKEKLYQAIGYQENSAPLDLPEHYEAIRMNFKLIAFEIGLFDDSKVVNTNRKTYDLSELQTLMLLKFSMATCSLQQRPAASAISLTAGMKEMKLTGLVKDANTPPPTIISSHIAGDFNLLDIFFETNPLDKKCDQRIKVNARPLQIVYDADTILHVINVFSPPKTVNLSELEGAASERMANFKERSATGMQYMIDKHAILDVNILFMPNILIIPQSGTYVPGEQSVIVVSLGQLHISSDPHHKSVDLAHFTETVHDQGDNFNTIADKAYDKFRISIDDMQIVVAKPNENWEEVLTFAAFSDMHILRPTSIIIAADLCVVNDDPRLPQTKVNIELPSININVTEERFFEALNVLSSLPLPESDVPQPTPLAKAASSLSASRRSLTAFLNKDLKKSKANKKSETELTTEIIQYTTLELSFALKEFSVTLHKSRTDAAGVKCDLSPSDSNNFGTPVDDVLSANEEFEDTTSRLVTADTLTLETEKLISLQILGLEAAMAQRTYELVATAKLRAINLTQYSKESEITVIDTPGFNLENKYLLTVAFTAANKTSPEFATKYNSTEQLIVVNFATLDIALHQEYLLYLMEIANALQSKLDAINASKPPKDRIASADDEGIISKLATIVEEELDEDAETTAVAKQDTRKQRDIRVVDSIKIHLIAKMEQVSLLLTCCKRPIASLKVQHFDAGVVLKSSYTELNLMLKDIIVTDLNPKSIHTSILSIVGNNALNCQVVMFNMDETADYNSDDMKITVEIGCMKIVFLNWFVTSVLAFLNNFQAAQQALANASAAAADAAKQNALDAYQKATRMKLNIKIKAPIIVVPVDSQSFNALALDLGSLSITNSATEVPVAGNEHSPAVVDEIQLDLKDMKLSKVSILGEDSAVSIIGSMDTTDLAYGMKSDINILNPTSFTLNVKRNLSSSWYKNIPEMNVSGRLKSIELNLFMEDYSLIMSILNRNLNEGLNEFPPPEQPTTTAQPAKIVVNAEVNGQSLPASPSRRTVKRQTSIVVKKPQEKVPDKTTVYEQLRFNFQFDGVVANLMLGPNEGLARFGLYFLSLKGKKLINGTLSTSIVLCDIQLDDTRSNTKSKITKYLCRKDWKDQTLARQINPPPVKDLIEGCNVERNYMLDITAIIQENDTFAEVRVSGFDLILCIDFLLKLTDFITLPEEAAPIKPNTPPVGPIPTQLKAVDSKTSTASAKPITDEGTEKHVNLMLYIEEPDIILIESLEDFNTNAIIFNAQAQLNYRGVGEKQLINGEIKSLKMYMCSFMPAKREETKHYIIHPCVISLQGSTPEHEGLHISLKMSEIIINVSPATIELFNKAMLTINANSIEKTLEQKHEANYISIWNARKFKERDHWFVKVEQAQEAFEIASNSDEDAQLAVVKTEKCVIEIPSIAIIVESGVGYYTTPLIMFDTRLNAVASNWSRDLSVNGSLTLQMNYYNQALAVWEPIIEMNEHLQRNGDKQYLPWELSFGLAIESKPSEFEEDVIQKTTKIKVQSDENLELTVSKSFMNVLNVLSEAFSQAMDEKGLIKPEVIAPNVVENDTGFDISLNFRKGLYTLHECHMPRATATNHLNRSLVFQADEAGADLTPDQIKDCTISPSGRAYLRTKNLSTLSEEDELEQIYVKVGNIDKEVILPVAKSDKRYFPLYRDTHQDPWGIVSEVVSEFGTTKINIHGVVNVHNHFTTGIKIYRMKPNVPSEKILVGEVGPGEIFHVPLHAIYSENKDLFFALNGYKTSVQGIKWNDCPTDLSYTRQLQCDPIDTYETLYMNAIREKTEVFHEDTNKYKLLSAYYTIHLRPPLYLRNALPINIKISVAGCSVVHDDAKPKDLESDETDGDFSKSVVKEDLLDYGEKEVEPGDVLQLPTVKLSGQGKEARSFIVVRLIQYLEKDWSSTTEVSGVQGDMRTWKFSSYDSAAKMDMDLCVRFDDRHGSIMVTLYSPFWMINKTGLMLSYKTESETVDVLYHPPEYNGPILFSFREKFFFDKKAATIRVDNGEWSDKIPLDVAGSIGEVTCKSNDMSYQIGVHNHLTHNSLTKQITFIPFYIATNKCDFPIELQEQSRPADPWLKIEPHACIPIWPKNDSDYMLVARVSDQRTKAFKYSDVQCTLLQLAQNKYGGLNVDVQTTEGGVYITFTEYNPGDAPGLLINHTSKAISYYEKVPKSAQVQEHTLQPQHEILYTWMDPAGDKCLIFGKNKVENDLRKDGVGELILEGKTKAYWVSFLDGLQRVVLFTEVEQIATRSESSSVLQTVTQAIEVRIHGIGLSILNNETGVDIMYLGITSSGIIWESKKENKKRFKQMKIHDTTQIEAQYQQYLIDKSVNQVKTYHIDGKHQIDFEHMTLMKNNKNRQVLRTFYPGVWISMKTSPFQTQLHAKINKIQLDNQLIDCIFPVVLAPIAPPKSVSTTAVLKPFVECSMVQRVVPNSTVKQYKYASMLIQEFHFKVDLLFLTAIAEMFAGNISDEQAAKLFNENVQSIEKPLSDLVETHSMQEQKNFYDNLHLGPLKIHVSFSMAGSDTTALPGILSTLVQGVGVTLTDVNDVVFRLAFFERDYQFFTQHQLTSEITTHYTGQALKQLYVLVLGLDVLGNPYGLVVGLKKGVEDLFYEPFQGAIQGPGEFAEGLVLGVKSLFGHTVGGAAGAVSKITGAMGKGLAALTFDEEYQKKRRQNLNKKPTNFQEGIARSGKGLVMGFVDGVTGVVTKPVAGAREEGVEGFFKGLGKGAIGLVARPTAGVVDFASGTFESVKRATETSEEANRLRPPRFQHTDNVLRPYCRAEAEGNKMLKEVEKGKYATTDAFIHCEEIVQKRDYVLVSNHRVIYITKNDLFGTWTIQWTYLWHEIAAITSCERGVDILLKKEGKKVLGLFSSHEAQHKLIILGQKERRDKLAEIMESQRKEA